MNGMGQIIYQIPKHCFLTEYKKNKIKISTFSRIQIEEGIFKGLGIGNEVFFIF